LLVPIRSSTRRPPGRTRPTKGSGAWRAWSFGRTARGNAWYGTCNSASGRKQTDGRRRPGGRGQRNRHAARGRVGRGVPESGRPDSNRRRPAWKRRTPAPISAHQRNSTSYPPCPAGLRWLALDRLSLGLSLAAACLPRSAATASATAAGLMPEKITPAVIFGDLDGAECDEPRPSSGANVERRWICSSALCAAMWRP